MIIIDNAIQILAAAGVAACALIIIVAGAAYAREWVREFYAELDRRRRDDELAEKDRQVIEELQRLDAIYGAWPRRPVGR